MVFFIEAYDRSPVGQPAGYQLAVLDDDALGDGTVAHAVGIIEAAGIDPAERACSRDIILYQEAVVFIVVHQDVDAKMDPGRIAYDHQLAVERRSGDIYDPEVVLFFLRDIEVIIVINSDGC